MQGRRELNCQRGSLERPSPSLMRSRPPIWVHAGALFAVLIATYTSTFNGTTRVDDEQILAARAQSLALRGQLESPQVYGNDRFRELVQMGDQATQIEPLQSLLGGILYRLGIAFGWGGRQTAFSLGLYATAAATALLLLAVDQLGFRRSTAWLVALGFGLATPAFPYAETFYRDSLAMAFGSLAILGLALVTHRDRGRRWVGAILISLGIMLGSLTKNTMLVMAPALVVGFGPTLVGALRSHRLRLWLPIGVLGLVLASALLIPPDGPLARFSWDYYRQLTGFFIQSVKPGLALAILGPWLSPSKSLFLFAPPLLLALLPSGRGKINPAVTRTTVAFAVLLSLGQGLFYRDAWFAGFGWGLRFMLPALPGLMLLTAPAIDDALTKGRTALATVASLIAMGSAFQAAAAWTPWQPIYRSWIERGWEPYSPSAAWDPRLLAVPGQLALALQPSNWDTGWLRLLASNRRDAIWIPIFSAVLIVISALVLTLIRRRGDEPVIRRLTAALCLVSLVLPIFPTMPLLQGDPGVADDRRAFHGYLKVVETELKEEDVVVVDSYGTPLWSFMSNRWAASNRWYSLPFEVPSLTADQSSNAAPSEATIDLFNRLLTSGHRIWYVNTAESATAGLGRELQWLRDHATVKSTISFEGKVPLFLFEVEP